MTYLELIRRADRQIDKNCITLGEYEKMIEPLRQEVIPVHLEQKTDKWIPVVVKLPEEEEKPYWVCLDDGYQCECRWTNDMYGIGANEFSEWGWHIIDKPQYSRVVAWMPLPEPYQPKEGE